MTIAMMDEGGEFVVEHVCLCRETGKRLADMGFTRGACGRIVRKSLWGGPIQVRLGEYDLMIRASEANGVVVEEAAEGSGHGAGRRHGKGHHSHHGHHGHRGRHKGGRCHASGEPDRP